MIIVDEAPPADDKGTIPNAMSLQRRAAVAGYGLPHVFFATQSTITIQPVDLDLFNGGMQVHGKLWVLVQKARNERQCAPCIRLDIMKAAIQHQN